MVRLLNRARWIRRLIIYCRSHRTITLLSTLLLLIFVALFYFYPSADDPTIPLIEEATALPLRICEPISNPLNLTTLVIMSYTNNDALMMLLSKYNDCHTFGGILHEIVIVWNNPDLSFDFNHNLLVIDDTDHIIPIHVYPQSINSLANRWFIAEHHSFATESAVFIDDDMFINEHSIACMLETFHQNKWKIVAPSHTHLWTTRQFEQKSGSDNEWLYKNIHTKRFNMLLPGMSMFNVAYLPKLAHTLVDYDLLPIINEQVAHCDDICMMLSVAMLNHGKPYLLGIDFILIEEFGSFRKQPAMTDKSKLKLRYQQRSECLSMIVQRFMAVNKEKGKEPINPIVDHQHGVDSIDCHKCEYCDNRGCWWKSKKKKK